MRGTFLVLIFATALCFGANVTALAALGGGTSNALAAVLTGAACGGLMLAYRDMWG